MAKSKHSENSARNRKTVAGNSAVHSDSYTQYHEKSRTRRTHRRSRVSIFGNFGSVLCRRLGIGAIILVALILMAHYGVQHNRRLHRQKQVFTPINLPRIISENEVNAEVSPELFWGSYRPNVFFGMSHRSPHSLLFGLAWVATNEKSVQVHHQCTSEGEVKSYNWIEHDGRNYGIQTIISGNHNITTAFVKRPNVPNGGDWTARISVAVVNRSNPIEPITLIFYAYLPDVGRGKIYGFDDGNGKLTHIRGFTQELGAFQVDFHSSNVSVIYPQTSLMGSCPREDLLLASISSGLALRPNRKSVFFKGYQDGLFEGVSSPAQMPTNLWATELTLKPSSGVSAPQLEVEFVSQASTSSDAVSLTGYNFDKALAEHSQRFHEHFANRFPHDSNRISEEQLLMSKISLSNLLGGIGYFYGQSKVTSPLFDSYSAVDVESWPTGLFTATPSRSQFPRGFLWDEGFHALLMARWDVELVLQCLGHWLDLINAEGWIPREQILGWEARASVPPEFLIQSSVVANPPALILPIEDLLDRLDVGELSKEEEVLFTKWISLAFPRLRAWFLWFSSTQAGELPTAFRWRGRPTDNPFQLNPLTLASGLDDYPRASHPTTSERHVDLRSWMAAFAKTLARLADRVYGASAPEALNYHAAADELLDPAQLDVLHWNEEAGLYADFGLNTDALSLEKPIPARALSPGEPEPRMLRKVRSEPVEGWISSSVGYVSFFPMFLRLVPPSSPRLPTLFSRLGNPDLLFSPHGLRSLSPSSPYYNRKNTDMDPPYWRGAIWMNINYLAVRALRYYAHHPETPPEVARQAIDLHKRLTANLISTVFNEMNRTGMTWERYDDRTGRGLSGHPFNGWTALVSLLATTEESDSTRR